MEKEDRKHFLMVAGIYQFLHVAAIVVGVLFIYSRFVGYSISRFGKNTDGYQADPETCFFHHFPVDCITTRDFIRTLFLVDHFNANSSNEGCHSSRVSAMIYWIWLVASLSWDLSFLPGFQQTSTRFSFLVPSFILNNNNNNRCIEETVVPTRFLHPQLIISHFVLEDEESNRPVTPASPDPNSPSSANETATEQESDLEWAINGVNRRSFVHCSFRLNDIEESIIEATGISIDAQHYQRPRLPCHSVNPLESASSATSILEEDRSLSVILKFLNETQKPIVANSNDTISRLKR